MPKRSAPGQHGGNGNGMMVFLEGSPWYVKVVLGFLMFFGFPVGVTAFLLMVVVGYIPSPLTQLDKNMLTHMEDMRKTLTLTEGNQRVMRAICRNTAKDPVERVECDR